MADVWEFRNPEAGEQRYGDGTIVPHLEVELWHNGKKVGEVEMHMHKRKGRDGVVDTSFGSTHIIYGPPAGGK